MSFLTEDQILSITTNYLYHHGPASKEQIFEVLEKVEEMMITATFFNGIMDNKVGIAGVACGDLALVNFGTRMYEDEK